MRGEHVDRDQPRAGIIRALETACVWRRSRARSLIPARCPAAALPDEICHENALIKMSRAQLVDLIHLPARPPARPLSGWLGQRTLVQ